MKTPAGRKRFLDFAISSGLTKKFPPVFWESLSFGSVNLLSSKGKETVKKLKEDPDVGEFDADKELRGYGGNLPFKNVIEAKEWIAESIAIEKKRLMSSKEDGGENLSEDKAKLKARKLFAENNNFPKFKTMLKREGVYTEKFRLDGLEGLNDPDFVTRQDDSIDQLGKVFEIFQNEVMRNADGTMNFEGVAFVGALLSSSSYGQGHFVRTAAPFRFYQKGYMKTGSSNNTLEHTLPATLVGKYLFIQALDGSVKDSFKNIKLNYFQGPLSDSNDDRLFGKKPNGEAFDYRDQTPENWKITDNIWYRYFNLNVAGIKGGINPADLIIADKESVFSKFGITPSGFKITDSQKNSYSKTSKSNSDLSNLIDENNSTQKQIYDFSNIDKALENGRKLNKTEKGISVFDFDDTLARTNSKIVVTMPESVQSVTNTGDAKKVINTVYKLSLIHI